MSRSGLGAAYLLPRRQGRHVLSQCAHMGAGAQYSLAAKHLWSVLASKSILVKETSLKGNGLGTWKVWGVVTTKRVKSIARIY